MRKAGGTSVNHIFLGLGNEEGRQIYSGLSKSPINRVISGDKVFVGWNGRLIDEGNYFFAFSHRPAHVVNLPLDTFTLTCLRDPAKRVISHYKMILEEQSATNPHPFFKTEGQ